MADQPQRRCPLTTPARARTAPALRNDAGRGVRSLCFVTEVLGHVNEARSDVLVRDLSKLQPHVPFDGAQISLRLQYLARIVGPIVVKGEHANAPTCPSTAPELSIGRIIVRSSPYGMMNHERHIYETA